MTNGDLNTELKNCIIKNLKGKWELGYHRNPVTNVIQYTFKNKNIIRIGFDIIDKKWRGTLNSDSGLHLYVGKTKNELLKYIINDM